VVPLLVAPVIVVFLVKVGAFVMVVVILMLVVMVVGLRVRFRIWVRRRSGLWLRVRLRRLWARRWGGVGPRRHIVPRQ
jgi:hypothetical protein